MESLSMPVARQIVQACLDDRNPIQQSAALAKRDDWLILIDQQLLHPEPGVREALEGLKVE